MLNSSVDKAWADSYAKDVILCSDLAFCAVFNISGTSICSYARELNGAHCIDYVFLLNMGPVMCYLKKKLERPF